MVRAWRLQGKNELELTISSLGSRRDGLGNPREAKSLEGFLNDLNLFWNNSDLLRFSCTELCFICQHCGTLILPKCIL